MDENGNQASGMGLGLYIYLPRSSGDTAEIIGVVTEPGALPFGLRYLKMCGKIHPICKFKVTAVGLKVRISLIMHRLGIPEYFLSTYLKAGFNNHEVVVPNKAPPNTSLG